MSIEPHTGAAGRAGATRFVLLLCAAALCLGSGPARAEFEVQESTIDAGEIQLQYRGAVHDGLALGDEDEEPLRQSQEFELQMSVTSHWLLAFTQGYTQPDGENFEINAIEFESQVELITLEDEGFGLAMQGGVERAVGNARGEPNDFHFGPIWEYGVGKLLLTNDILFFREYGAPTEQEGMGLEYSFQAAYSATDKLVLALEAFGEIESLSDTGPFETQEHYIGPTFYYTWGDDDENYETDAAKSGGAGKYAEFTVSFGLQFGLTEASSDMAGKVFVGYEFN